ncbi:CopG family transcriptional regulator [Cryptosporangium arvum]|uniref:ribbon-helix-helix domain-containing protein n=1 Tax=Cryptosporangium arvum TaxID=80871 RepID=UPI0004AD82A4|nr:CopG family transcriptional regulator [Cryptosporangium arvum]
MSRDEAMEVLAGTDWSGAVAETPGRGATVVHSTRLPAALSTQLEAEAARRGVTPSALVREYVEAGLTQLAATGDATVTLRLADLHRAIDQLARDVA